MSTVVAYSAVTDGSTATSATSDTYADVTALTVTVANAEVGDQLFITATCFVYTDGSNSNIRFTVMVDGVAERTNMLYSTSGGNVLSVPLQWALTLEAGDITAGETVVKLRWAKYSAGSATTHLLNSSDGVATLQVLQIKA